MKLKLSQLFVASAAAVSFSVIAAGQQDRQAQQQQPGAAAGATQPGMTQQQPGAAAGATQQPGTGLGTDQ
ncbi:MAG TPA: hypothetical protein VM489_12750, partial [Burkholderiales bacterium]|nr:hypothetical protein [Burkholderiales bacterium]